MGANRLGSKGNDAEKERSNLYLFAKGLDKFVNLLALILFVLLILYAAHSIWYTHSLQKDSFLSEELAQYKPDGRSPSLGELMKINPDVRAWICIDDTNIDYPVVQGKDDFEYLNKTVLGEFSLAGSIFLSSDNKKDFSNKYNLVHGHHVEGGAMLADVVEFRDASFFNEHQKGTLWYPSSGGRAKVDRIEIFAVLQTSGDDGVIYGPPSRIKEDSFNELIGDVLEKAIQKRSVKFEKNSRVIALSTCENAVDIDRVVLFGKLTPMTDKEIHQLNADTSRTNGQHGWIQDKIVWLLLPLILLILILLAYLLHRIRKMKNEK